MLMGYAPYSLCENRS